MRITVFTPTYNRSYIIERLYHSLKRQTFRDFEWIVIDDGSTDDTELRFTQIQNDSNDFPIHYIKTANGGKHRAINNGVTRASGELFYIVDSDDYLPDDALETIDRVEQTIPVDKRNIFCGICGVKSFPNEESIGSSFDGEYLDITTLERPAYGITGDKAEVFYTGLLRRYPFPEYENENFVTECIVWDRIAADGYHMRFFNQSVMICEYLPDGLSAKSQQLFLNNPKGYGLLLYQNQLYGKTRGLNKWNAYLHYFYCYREKCNFFQISRNLHTNPVVLWIRLFGMRLFYKLYDK